MTEKGGLIFEFEKVPATAQVFPNIINCGDVFDVVMTIRPKKGTFNHRGVDCEFCSELSPKGGKVVKIATRAEHLSEPGTFSGPTKFTLPNIKIGDNAQTYHGGSFSMQHWIRVFVKKTFGTVDVSEEITAYRITGIVKTMEPLCVRVAVSDSIRIDLLTARRKFDIGDVICGAAHFLTVNLKLSKFMVHLMAQELVEANGKTKKEKYMIQKWEITDGTPVKGEIAPFRLYLDPVNVSPTVSDPDGGYSVTHFLHFTIHTVSGENYFKALQIKLFKWNQLPFKFTGE